MTDFRALCAELVAELHCYKIAHPQHEEDLIDRARAALANAEPAPTSPVAPLAEGEGLSDAPWAATEPPTEDEIAELYEIAVAAQAAGTLPSDSTISLLTDWHGWDEAERRHCLAAARVALARWGLPAAPPTEGEMTPAMLGDRLAELATRLMAESTPMNPDVASAVGDTWNLYEDAPDPVEVNNESIEAICERTRRKYDRSGRPMSNTFTMNVEHCDA